MCSNLDCLLWYEELTSKASLQYLSIEQVLRMCLRVLSCDWCLDGFYICPVVALANLWFRNHLIQEGGRVCSGLLRLSLWIPKSSVARVAFLQENRLEIINFDLVDFTEWVTLYFGIYFIAAEFYGLDALWFLDVPPVFVN